MHSVVERRPVVLPCIAPVTVQKEAPSMKRGGGLHPSRPDCWPPTKQPRPKPGGLMADGVRNVSR